MADDIFLELLMGMSLARLKGLRAKASTHVDEVRDELDRANFQLAYIDRAIAAKGAADSEPAAVPTGTDTDAATESPTTPAVTVRHGRRGRQPSKRGPILNVMRTDAVHVWQPHEVSQAMESRFGITMTKDAAR